jgi:hypothetical protein
MRFLMLSNPTGSEPDETLYAEMGKFVEELSQQGVLLATGGLNPVGTHVKSAGGELTFTDGPFSEAKEAIGGFALVEVRSREEMVEISRRFWKIVGDGEGRVHEVN